MAEYLNLQSFYKQQKDADDKIIDLTFKNDKYRKKNIEETAKRLNANKLNMVTTNYPESIIEPPKQFKSLLKLDKKGQMKGNKAVQFSSEVD